MAKKRPKPTDEEALDQFPLQTDPPNSGPPPVKPESLEEKPPKKEPPCDRQTNRPVCPYGHGPMKAGSSTPHFTYYYCEVKTCEYHRRSIKQPRPFKRHVQRPPDRDFSAR